MDLLAHQIEAVEFLTRTNYSILADNMGLGKSRSAIEACKGTHLLVVICPSYLKANWDREIKKWGYSGRYHIFSYEFVASGKADIYFTKGMSLILDEAHYIKNHKAKRTRAIHDYVDIYDPDQVFLLSGTPAKNRITELYSLFMLVAKGNSDTRKLMAPWFNYYAFCEHFTIATRKNIMGRTIVQYSGHRNLPELKTIMETCYLRRLKMEIDLPSMRDIRIELDLDKSVEGLEEFESTGSISTAMASRKAENALKKAPHTAKFCKDIIAENQCEQIVIFCDHVNSVNLMASLLDVTSIHGGVGLEERDRIVQAFIRGETKYLVTTIGTSSTGLNLVNTHVMVFNSFPYVSGDLEQAKKRINRIGQSKDCIYYYMIAGEIDDRILTILESKQKTLEEGL